MSFLPLDRCPLRLLLLVLLASALSAPFVGLFSVDGYAQDGATPPPEVASPPPEVASPPPEVASPPPEATKSQAAPPATAAPTAEKKPLVRLDKTQPEGRMFGKYRIRVGVAKPKFNNGLKYYDELYGGTGGLPTLGVDWFPWDFYATLGLSFRLSYYTDDGYAAQSVGGGPPTSSSQVEADHNGPTTLTLIPLQICLAAEMSPFRGKWIVLDGWFGFERTYWQETRVAPTASTTPATTIAATNANKNSLRLGRPSYLLDTPSTDATDTSLVNSGTKTASVLGFAANILLNPLDEQSALSSRGTLGIGSVYLSPYMEIVRTLGKTGVSFGRTALGLGFTFETAR